MTIYRGYDINARKLPHGMEYSVYQDGTYCAGPFQSEEKAMDWIDKEVKRLRRVS